MEDQRQAQGTNTQVKVLKGVRLRVVAGRVLHSAEVHHGSGEAETKSFTGLVEPVARLVERKVALEGDDCAESKEEDDQVAFHHLQGDALARSSNLHLQSHHQKAEGAE